MTVRTAGRAAWRGVLVGVALVVSVLAFVAAAGAAIGFRPVVVVTGSMGEAMPVGSLAIAGPTDDVVVGDVLVMRVAGRPTVTHRVVGVGVDDAGVRVVTTRGDANPDVDPTVHALDGDDLTVRRVVPGLGHAVLAIRSPWVGGPLVGFIVAGLLWSVLRRIWGAPARHRSGLARTSDGAAAMVEPAEPVEPVASVVPPPPSVGRRRPARLDRAALGAATVAAVSIVGITALALYTATASADGLQFTSRDCFDARLQGVQRGSKTTSAAGVTSVAIAPVDPTRAFVLFSASSADGEPDESVAGVRLSGPTTVEIVRATDGAPPGVVEVEWSVVEYACGVTVQRGTMSGGGTAITDLPVSPVDPSSSFALVSSIPAAGTVDYSGALLTSAALIDADTLRVRAETPIPVSTQIEWQVVTFDDPDDAVVRTVSATLGVGAASGTVVLPAPVDPGSTMLVAGVRSANSGAAIGDRMVRVRLLDDQTIELQRALTTGGVTVDVQVIELRDGSTVQHGVLDLAAGQPVATASIPPVTPGRSTAISTVALAAGASGGSTSMAGDDVVGEGAVRVRLIDSRTVGLVRDATSSSASFAWQVVTWGGPVWADLDSPFRRRIDVAGGSVATPDGYTTSLSFDHAEMVAAAQSRADGDDVRIWRHDGSTWAELDRVVDDTNGWNAADTTVWFRTREPIAAGQTVSYWLYFGDPSPAPVLAEPANVWLAVEDFDDGDLGIFEDRTGGTGWYRADPWTRRFVLTIPAGATTADLVDQPVLVRMASVDLASAAQPDGSDIRFTAGDGITPLAHEIESYDAINGSLTAWVRVPNVSTSASTTIHLFAGAADAPAQADADLVWSDGFAVWQLAADPAGSAPALADSGPGRLDGVALADAALATDPAGAAVVLDGALDRLESAPFVPPRSALTVAAWFRVDDNSREQVLVTQGDPTTAGSFELAVEPVAGFRPRFRLRAGGAMIELAGGSVSTGAWHHLTATWDGATARLFLDGVEVANGAAAGTMVVDGPIPAVIGAAPDGSRALTGSIGQVRIDDVGWAAARVDFAAANLLDPSATVVVATSTSGTWFDQGDWTIRRPLAIESDLVAGPLTDYPLLVQLVDADLATGLQNEAGDLVFTAADGITRLDHQLESWDPLTGALTAWVRVPNLVDGTDSLLYLYLANPTAIDQQDPVGVWGPAADLVVLG